jgi:hypothetical protein
LSIVNDEVVCRKFTKEMRKLELKIQEEKGILAKKQHVEIQIQLTMEAIEVQKALHTLQNHEHQKRIEEL